MDVRYAWSPQRGFYPDPAGDWVRSEVQGSGYVSGQVLVVYKLAQ